MVTVRRELKILDETGLPEKNWKNEIATKKKLAGSNKKNSFVRPRNEFAVKNRRVERQQEYSNDFLFLGSHAQLWKVDDNLLKNLKGIWKSVDLWNLKTKDDLVYIENTTKGKVLAISNNNQVILEDFVPGKPEQLWKKGEPDDKGYYILESSLEGLPSHKKVPKVIAAISETGLEIEGNITEIKVS